MKAIPQFILMSIICLLVSNSNNASVLSPLFSCIQKFVIARLNDSSVPQTVEKVKKSCSNRRVRFLDNMVEASNFFPDYPSLRKVRCVIIDDRPLQSSAEDREIHNDRCRVTIEFMPGIVRSLGSIGEGFLRDVFYKVFSGLEPFLTRRVLSFACYLSPSCEQIDTASLLIAASAQAEQTPLHYRMLSPLAVEVSLDTPVEF